MKLMGLENDEAELPIDTAGGRTGGELNQMGLRCPPVKGHGTKFERKKEAAVAALLTQKNHEEAARSSRLSNAGFACQSSSRSGAAPAGTQWSRLMRAPSRIAVPLQRFS